MIFSWNTLLTACAWLLNLSPVTVFRKKFHSSVEILVKFIAVKAGSSVTIHPSKCCQLVLDLLSPSFFFHSLTLALLPSPPPQTREKRNARHVCRSYGSREKNERRNLALGPELERWQWAKWRRQQMVQRSAKSPRQIASHSRVFLLFLSSFKLKTVLSAQVTTMLIFMNNSKTYRASW